MEDAMLKRMGQGQAVGHWVWQVREVVSFIVIISLLPDDGSGYYNIWTRRKVVTAWPKTATAPGF